MCSNFVCSKISLETRDETDQQRAGCPLRVYNDKSMIHRAENITILYVTLCVRVNIRYELNLLQQACTRGRAFCKFITADQ